MKKKFLLIQIELGPDTRLEREDHELASDVQGFAGALFKAYTAGPVPAVTVTPVTVTPEHASRVGVFCIEAT
jgi:hypothetical protein